MPRRFAVYILAPAAFLSLFIQASFEEMHLQKSKVEAMLRKHLNQSRFEANPFFCIWSLKALLARTIKSWNRYEESQLLKPR